MKDMDQNKPEKRNFLEVEMVQIVGNVCFEKSYSRKREAM